MDHFPIQAYVHTPKMLVPYFVLHNNFWGPPQGLQSDPACANAGTGPYMPPQRGQETLHLLLTQQTRKVSKNMATNSFFFNCNYSASGMPLFF